MSKGTLWNRTAERNETILNFFVNYINDLKVKDWNFTCSCRTQRAVAIEAIQQLARPASNFQRFPISVPLSVWNDL